jgi:hypothetical protein
VTSLSANVAPVFASYTVTNMLHKMGTILYILPISYRKINPNKQIELFIKYLAIKNMSNMIYDDGFPIKLKDYLKKNAKIRVFEEK